MIGSWHQALVSPDTSIGDTLQILDRSGLRMVLVADAGRKLMGIVTDGDIRRALLKRRDFGDAICTIMNNRPCVATIGTVREALRSLMEERGILHIPLVDAENHIVGVETYRELLGPPVRDNWILLMAGGFGTRLGALTSNCPKPMLPIESKPLLQRTLERFISIGFRNFLISVHYLPEKIQSHFGDGSAWGIRIRYIYEETPLGTGGALGLLPKETLMHPLIMMNGDVLTQLDFNALLSFHCEQDAALTLCSREYDMRVPFGVVEYQDTRVTGIVEKPMHSFFVNAGIYVVSPRILPQITPSRRIDMPDLVQELIKSNERVSMFPIHEYWIDIGRPDDLERAQNTLLS